MFNGIDDMLAIIDPWVARADLDGDGALVRELIDHNLRRILAKRAGSADIGPARPTAAANCLARRQVAARRIRSKIVKI